MSKVNVLAFWQKVEQDPVLRERLDAIPRESQEGAMAEVVKIADELGLPITVEELIASGKDTTDGLTEDELADVAGGGGLGPSGGPLRGVESRGFGTAVESRGFGTAVESRGNMFKSSFFKSFGK